MFVLGSRVVCISIERMAWASKLRLVLGVPEVRLALARVERARVAGLCLVARHPALRQRKSVATLDRADRRCLGATGRVAGGHGDAASDLCSPSVGVWDGSFEYCPFSACWPAVRRSDTSGAGCVGHGPPSSFISARGCFSRHGGSPHHCQWPADDEEVWTRTSSLSLLVASQWAGMTYLMCACARCSCLFCWSSRLGATRMACGRRSDDCSCSFRQKSV